MRLHLSLLLIFFPILLYSNNDTICTINSSTVVKEVWPYSQVYVDSTGDQSFDEVINSTSWTKIRPYQHSGFPITYWIRLKITSADTLQNYHLAFQRDRTHDKSNDLESLLDINQAEAWYLLDENVLHYYRTGFFVDAEERAISNRKKDGFPLSIMAGDTIEIYIRVQNLFDNNDYYLGMQIEDPFVVNTQHSRFTPFAFFLSSIFFILGIYSLILYFVVREEAYLVFSMFCLITSPHFNLAYFYEIFPEVFLFENPDYFPLVFTFSTSVGFILFLIFGRMFSNIKHILPNWDRYYVSLIIILALIALSLFYRNFHPPYEPNPVYFILILFAYIPVFIRLIMHENILAKLFGIGASLMVFFFILGFLWAAGIRLPIHPFYWGFITVVLFFSLGLAWKIRFNERARTEAEQIMELDKMKSRFFANISHEFRTPISLILGPLNQAEEQIPASEDIENSEGVPITGKYIRMMKRNALRLQNLVNQLLDLSKLESGKTELQVRNGNIIKFLRAIVFSFESRAENRNIDFHTIFPKELEETWFDRDKLEKIIVNLLSNAFKYTPDNGRIDVMVKSNSGKIKVKISDSGPGIQSEELDKIFDRFYRLESDDVKGTGIGLSLVKELVDLHRGQISVNSTVGIGTSFKLTLPIQKNAYQNREIVSQIDESSPDVDEYNLMESDSSETSRSSTAKGQRPSIMIVEDNSDLRAYIRDILEDDFRMAEAADGQEGLDLAIETIPDLIISDVMMPKMDGFTFCEEMKTNEKTSHIPVILLTAKAGQSHKLEGLQTGADAYLTKPFDRKELTLRVKNLIEQRKFLKEKFSNKDASFFTQTNVSSMEKQFINKVVHVIKENLDNEFYTVEELAKSIGFSRSQLFRKLQAVMDRSPSELIREIRLERAYHLLEENSGTVSEIAYKVGYSNLSYFTRSFKKKYGKTPSEL